MDLNILAHRGLWLKPEEKNSFEAIKRAFDDGFGIETDLRDIMGKIVISHNCPIGNEFQFTDLLDYLKAQNKNSLMLALNIKADGLSDELYRILTTYNYDQYFTFDMSIPELWYQHCGKKLKTFTGISDLCPTPILYDSVYGVWLDAFTKLWYDNEQFSTFANKIIKQDHKKLCIVSEDLHQRDPNMQWSMIKEYLKKDHQISNDVDQNNKQLFNHSLYLCTDKPLEAREYFND